MYDIPSLTLHTQYMGGERVESFGINVRIEEHGKIKQDEGGSRFGSEYELNCMNRSW